MCADKFIVNEASKLQKHKKTADFHWVPEHVKQSRIQRMSMMDAPDSDLQFLLIINVWVSRHRCIMQKQSQIQCFKFEIFLSSGVLGHLIMINFLMAKTLSFCKITLFVPYCKITLFYCVRATFRHEWAGLTLVIPRLYRKQV